MKFLESLGKCYGGLFDFLIRVCFRVLGTPTEESWPGVAQLPDYKSTFPFWSPQKLQKSVPKLDAEGVDLLQVSFLI